MPTDLGRLWLRAQGAVYELIEERGTARTAVAGELKHRKTLVTRTFPPTREEAMKVPPDFDLAVEIFEHLGENPAHLFAVPPVVEEMLPRIPRWGRGKVEDATRRSRTTKALEEVREILETARRLEPEVPRSPEIFAKTWEDRRSLSPELNRAYEDLADRERRRHYEPETVAEECKETILQARGDELDAARAVRVIGSLGIWGTIKRVADYLRTARDILSWSVRLARRLGDESLLARELRRSAFVFLELGEPELAIAVLDQATRKFRGDQNEIGAAKILVDLGAFKGLQNDLRASERFYRAALEALPGEGHTVHRSWAAQGVATCLDLQGEVSGAVAFLERSAEMAESQDRRLCAALTYTAANLERKLGNYSGAEGKYWTAIRAFERLEDSDLVVLACLDLAAFLVEAGDHSRNSRLRSLLAEHLPQVRKVETLKFQTDLILLELSRRSTSAEKLREFAKELKKCSGGCSATALRSLSLRG